MKKWMGWVIILGGAFAAYWFFFKPNGNGNGGEAERFAQQRLARARARHS